MIDFIRSAAAFVLVLGVLVFFHELGHYLAARWRGVAVEAFSVGFGPALWSRTDQAGTVWKISVLPLGGYVKMRGWADPGDELPEGAALAPPDPGSFREKSIGSRSIIVAAGPIANMVLAFTLFLLLFIAVGQPNVAPVVSKLEPGSPAAMAGLQAGDRITAIDGQPIKDFSAIQALVIGRPGAHLTIAYQRGLHDLTTDAVAGSVKEGGHVVGQLGIVGSDVAYHRLGVPAAIAAAGTQTWQVASDTLVGLWNLVAHQKGLDQLGGPIRIARMSGQVAAHGVADLVSFIALLSINLGLVNLIPIPILDGGHLLFYGCEAIYRKPLPKQVQEYGLRFGAALLACIFIFATWNDLALSKLVSHLFG
ncbi:MAG TPA: RIP metalloprotease RseP [Acetobacteraceae bacterium]|nr:RIP metalloprotease RseP [Acetobacteraceae bacterium]